MTLNVNLVSAIVMDIAVPCVIQQNVVWNNVILLSGNILKVMAPKMNQEIKLKKLYFHNLTFNRIEL
jgi:hypothetical protein